MVYETACYIYDLLFQKNLGDKLLLIEMGIYINSRIAIEDSIRKVRTFFKNDIGNRHLYRKTLYKCCNMGYTNTNMKKEVV